MKKFEAVFTKADRRELWLGLVFGQYMFVIVFTSNEVS